MVTDVSFIVENKFENLLKSRTEQYSERKAGNNVCHREDGGNEKKSGVQNSLANAIRQQVHRCHTAIGMDISKYFAIC